jgi:carbon storage regulator
MLVLSRKVGERILIGDQISIVIVRINGNAVRVGIDAPTDLSVIRAELKQRMERDKAAPEKALQDSTAQNESALCEESPAQ